MEILGTNYNIVIDDNRLESEEVEGLCEFDKKNIILKKDYSDETLLHEMVHAYLYESGLAGECDWNKEEMVDWIANQFKKINKTFNEIRSNNG